MVRRRKLSPGRGVNFKAIGLWSLGLVLLLVATALGFVGWFISGMILVPAPYSLMPEFEIVAVDDGAVTMPVVEDGNQFADTAKAGTYGLVWQDGYGALGEVLARSDTQVTREIVEVSGLPPRAGIEARLEPFVYRGDPRADHGIAFEDLTLSGPVGPLRAWWVPNEGDTAVLLLHGRRRADLSETLRILPTIVDAGHPVLALAYRNHDVSAMSPDGFYHFGSSEWEDALAGLAFLAEQGLRRVVVFGYSLGGSVALETLEHLPSGTGVEVVGLILDSPSLDAPTAIRQGAIKMGLPAATALADLGLTVASWRSGVRWSSLDHRRNADRHRIPLLLIHGTGDTTVPVSLSDEFAARYGGPVDYQRVEGPEHIEVWNADPVRYEGWVREFLASVSGGSR